MCVSAFHLLSLDLPPIANGSAGGGNLPDKSALIPNGGPNTAVPCSPETPVANGVANGHVAPVQESPFIGYIIAMHRKMVRPLHKWETSRPGKDAAVTSVFVFSDAHGAVLPVVAEEPAQSVRHAAHRSVHGPHHEEGSVRCGLDPGVPPGQPAAPSGSQQPCPGLVRPVPPHSLHFRCAFGL